MAKDTPGRGSDQFPLRFPDGMRDELKKAAKENNRSLNAEIIARLEAYEQKLINSEQMDKAQSEQLDMMILKLDKITNKLEQVRKRAEGLEQALTRTDGEEDN